MARIEAELSKALYRGEKAGKGKKVVADELAENLIKKARDNDSEWAKFVLERLWDKTEKIEMSVTTISDEERRLAEGRLAKLLKKGEG
jgi:hypothetical protein